VGDIDGDDAVAAAAASSAQQLLAALVPAAGLFAAGSGPLPLPQPPLAGEGRGDAVLLRARTGGGDALLRPGAACRREWPPRLGRLTEAASRPAAAVGVALLAGVLAAAVGGGGGGGCGHGRDAAAVAADAAVTEVEPPPRRQWAAADAPVGRDGSPIPDNGFPTSVLLPLDAGSDEGDAATSSGDNCQPQQPLQLLPTDLDRAVLAARVDRLTAGGREQTAVAAAADAPTAAVPAPPAPAPAALAVGRRSGKRPAAAASAAVPGSDGADGTEQWLAVLLQGGDDAAGATGASAAGCGARRPQPLPLASLLLGGLLVPAGGGGGGGDAAATAVVKELDVPALLQPAAAATAAAALVVPPLLLTQPGGEGVAGGTTSATDSCTEERPPLPSPAQLAAWAHLRGAGDACSLGAPLAVTPLPTAVAVGGHLRFWAPEYDGDGRGGGTGARPSGESPAGAALVRVAGVPISAAPLLTVLPPLPLGDCPPSLLGAGAVAVAAAAASTVSVGCSGGGSAGGGTTAATSRLFAAAAAGAVAAALGRALAAAAPPPSVDANASDGSPQRLQQLQQAAASSKRKRDGSGGGGGGGGSQSSSPDRKHARPDNGDADMMTEGAATISSSGTTTATATGSTESDGSAGSTCGEPAWAAYARRRAVELVDALAADGVALSLSSSTVDGGDGGSGSSGGPWPLPHPDVLRPVVDTLRQRAAAAGATVGAPPGVAAAAQWALAAGVLLHTLAWLTLKPDDACRAEYVGRLRANRAYAGLLAAGDCGGDLPALARLLEAAPAGGGGAEAEEEAVAATPQSPPPAADAAAPAAPSPAEEGDSGDVVTGSSPPRFTARPHTAPLLQLTSPVAGGRVALLTAAQVAAAEAAEAAPVGEPRQPQPLAAPRESPPQEPGDVVLRVPVSSEGSCSLLQDVPLLRALEAPASVTVAVSAGGGGGGGGAPLNVPRFRFGLVERLALPPPVDLLLDEATAVALPALVGDLMDPAEYYGGGGGATAPPPAPGAPYFSDRLKGFTRALTEQARRYARLVVVVRLPAAGDGGGANTTGATAAAGLPPAAVRVLQALHVSGLNFPVPLLWRLAAGPAAAAAALRGLAAGAVLPRLLAPPPREGGGSSDDDAARLRRLAHAAARSWLGDDDDSVGAGGSSGSEVEAFLAAGCGLNPLLAARVAAGCGGAGGRAVAALAALVGGGGGAAAGVDGAMLQLLGPDGGGAGGSGGSGVPAALLAPAAVAVTAGAAWAGGAEASW
jgi:hypothetical protein